MPTSTMTSNGQITVPEEVQRHLRVAEGDRLEFLIAEDGSVRLQPVVGSVRDLLGLVRHNGAAAKTVAEMDRAISDHVAQDHERIRADRR
ncbi:MAG TPA: AbrB/MazE/SpoVT family DNA-binding domain-containing protein [Thermoanaerobaculia bacterium]|jgi:AbrB family looped-hinge helix DNA binding protein|nr:AbrB/MazE/SpoVT family DNA-binding domain-containing protein [Thermoanaerobaculia bacterium]